MLTLVLSLQIHASTTCTLPGSRLMNTSRHPCGNEISLGKEALVVSISESFQSSGIIRLIGCLGYTSAHLPQLYSQFYRSYRTI